MMICTENFYNLNLKGKTKEEIAQTIRCLKREIERLKSIVERPGYKCTVQPSHSVQIACLCDYLDRAKQALEEAGGKYIPTIREQKAMELEQNIPFISKLEFSIGGFFIGYKTKTYVVDEDKISIYTKGRFIPEGLQNDDLKSESIGKEEFISLLQDINIGQWRRCYNTKRFGMVVCDGIQWHLKLHFSNGHRSVRIFGDNAWPYNFSRALDLFQINDDIIK